MLFWKMKWVSSAVWQLPQGSLSIINTAGRNMLVWHQDTCVSWEQAERFGVHIRSLFSIPLELSLGRLMLEEFSGLNGFEKKITLQ